jgi:hypothetical protein
MTIDMLTKEDFYVLKNDLIELIRNLLIPQEQASWLKSLEVKDLLGCSDSTLQKHRISGRLPYTKLGGTYYYKKNDIESLLNRNSVQFRSGKSTQTDPLPPNETNPLRPFQIDPLIPAQTDPLNR